MAPMNASATLITTHSLPLRHYLQPATLLRTLWHNRGLVWQLTCRNVIGRYRGSALGLAWSFILPLMMLAIYTFVFGVVFHRAEDKSIIDYALKLYAGLLAYTMVSETLNLAPLLICGSPNYVKKVVFPLEILPLCTLGAALFHLLVGILVLLVCAAIFTHSISSTLICFPLVLLPLALWTLGFAWFLASLGVYLRDVGQFIGIATQMLMFLSPIFYDLSQVPRSFQTVMRLNPLTTLVQNARNTLLWGQAPDWTELAVVGAASLVVAQLGYVWFMKTRRGFADVL
jgi:lipopolysaccharide transport system permease protein